MIKFFRLSKQNFVGQNQMSFGYLVKIADCEKSGTKSMIKFFRQIRFSLMSVNKTSKYFKYTIGEIILVVNGILIALQINNWNQNRLDSNQE